MGPKFKWMWNLSFFDNNHSKMTTIIVRNTRKFYSTFQQQFETCNHCKATVNTAFFCKMENHKRVHTANTYHFTHITFYFYWEEFYAYYLKTKERINLMSYVATPSDNSSSNFTITTIRKFTNYTVKTFEAVTARKIPGALYQTT